MKQYLEKHTNRKGKRLKYDFLPPLQEVIDRPAHRAGSVIIFAIFALVASAVIWAAFMKTDMVISVTGVTEPEGELRVVQAGIGGVVEQIAVSGGSYVEKGDILLTLKQETAKMDIEEVKHAIDLLYAQQEVYQRLYKEEPLADIHSWEYGIYTWEVNYILEEHRVYENNVAILEMQAEDAVSEEEADLQIENYKRNRQLAIAGQITACKTRIRELEAAIAKAQVNLSAADIKASASGYLTELTVNNTGQVVTASQEIAYIVPQQSSLRLQCYLPDKDIAQIEIGQPVGIKWNAYPYSRYGVTPGSVAYISPAAAYSEQSGYVYTIYITFDNRHPEMEFLPGMSAVVDIKAGQRTILEYFLEPIKKGFENSLRET